jgi:SAM-dependent methyltransferase
MLACRFCHGSTDVIISLGMMPLANGLTLHVEEKSAKYPLEVVLCRDCGLAQLRTLIDPKELFCDYVYFSSHGQAMVDSSKGLCHRIIPTLDQNALVVEIASNDGYLLKNYVAAGVDVLGIDPAANIADVAVKNGVPTLCTFFGKDLAQDLRSQGKQADIIHANNVMAHVPDINGFVAGIKILLKPHGQAIIEVPYLKELVSRLAFDTIYHEHVYYFGMKTLRQLFDGHGLVISSVEELDLHGGSLRLFLHHQDVAKMSPRVQEMIHEEELMGLYTLTTYQDFMKQLDAWKDDLHQTLHTLKEEGKKIVAYGASAKGTTLLNYVSVGKDLLEFIVDKSPTKQGKYAPGTGLEIKAPSALLKNGITHALLLSWNFANEIMEEQREFIEAGGKFIIPVPQVKVMP